MTASGDGLSAASVSADEILAAMIDAVRRESRWLEIALESLYAMQGEWPMPEQGWEALEEDLRHMADA